MGRVVAGLVSTAAVALSACGDTPSAGRDVPAVPMFEGPVGTGEGALQVLAWPGFAEDGTTDPKVDWVTPFEQATGCTVQVTTVGTSEEAAQLLRQGGFDVVSVSGDATLPLIAEGAVQPINTALIPSYPDLVDGLRLQPWNSVDGVAYGIPQGRGANLLVWNTVELGPALDSWSVMFEADSPAAGGVSPYDSPISIADAAVYLMATRPELGITSPYALDQRQFDAAVTILETQASLSSNYWSDSFAHIAELTEGTTTASTTWQVVANAIAEPTIAVTKPKEGTTGWSDSWMIPADAPHVRCAYLWLEHMASPATNAQVAEFVGMAPANPKACALMTNADHCADFHAQDEAYWSDVYLWTTPIEQCLDGRTDVACVPYATWAKAWAELRGRG